MTSFMEQPREVTEIQQRGWNSVEHVGELRLVDCNEPCTSKNGSNNEEQIFSSPSTEMLFQVILFHSHYAKLTQSKGS